MGKEILLQKIDSKVKRVDGRNPASVESLLSALWSSLLSVEDLKGVFARKELIENFRNYPFNPFARCRPNMKMKLATYLVGEYDDLIKNELVYEDELDPVFLVYAMKNNEQAFWEAASKKVGVLGVEGAIKAIEYAPRRIANPWNVFPQTQQGVGFFLNSPLAIANWMFRYHLL